MIYEYAIACQHVHLKRKRLPGDETMGIRLNRQTEKFSPIYHRLCHASHACSTLPTLDCGDECLHTGHNKAKLNLSLLSKCKQVYEEALPILYSKNTFEIDGRALGVWTNSLAVAARERIAMLKIIAKLNDKVDGREWKAGCRAGAAMLKGLRELNVSVRLKKDVGMLSKIRENQGRIRGNQDWLKGILRFEALDLQKVELDFQGTLVWGHDEDMLLKAHLADLQDEVKGLLEPRVYGRSTWEDWMDRIGGLVVAVG